MVSYAALYSFTESLYQVGQVKVCLQFIKRLAIEFDFKKC